MSVAEVACVLCGVAYDGLFALHAIATPADGLCVSLSLSIEFVITSYPRGTQPSGGGGRQ